MREYLVIDRCLQLERRKVTNFTANKLCYMQEGKRQKQIGGLLHEQLSTLFQRLGLNMMDGGMVSISSVKITPDLLEARVYLSLFKIADTKAAMRKIEEREWEIKKVLAANVKQQLRR